MVLGGCALFQDDSIEVPADARSHVIDSGRLLYEAQDWTQGRTSTQTLILVIAPKGSEKMSAVKRAAESLQKRGWNLRNPHSAANLILTLDDPEAIVHLDTVEQYLSYPSRRDKINAEIRARFLRKDELIVAQIEPPPAVE